MRMFTQTEIWGFSGVRRERERKREGMEKKKKRKNLEAEKKIREQKREKET